jgi:hypothetical protein
MPYTSMRETTELPAQPALFKADTRRLCRSFQSRTFAGCGWRLQSPLDLQQLLLHLMHLQVSMLHSAQHTAHSTQHAISMIGHDVRNTGLV